MANSVDPDQMPHSVASDLGLHCLQRPICPNTLGYYSIQRDRTEILLTHIRCRKIWHLIRVYSVFTAFGNPVDPDEMAYYELSYQDLHYLEFCFCFRNDTILARMDMPNSKLEVATSETKGGKNYTHWNCISEKNKEKKKKKLSSGTIFENVFPLT